MLTDEKRGVFACRFDRLKALRLSKGERLLCCGPVRVIRLPTLTSGASASGHATASGCRTTKPSGYVDRWKAGPAGPKYLI